MFIPVSALTNAIFGAERREPAENGTVFRKCTAGCAAAWRAVSDDLFRNAQAATGIRLDLETDTEAFSFTARGEGRFELLVNQQLLAVSVAADRNDDGESPALSLAPGQKRLTLLFPSHGEAPALSGITLSDGAVWRPHAYDRRILFLGDSITQGWDSGYHYLSYAWQTSLRLNADSVINGIGGAYFLPEALEEASGFRPDTVVVAFGTNDYYRWASPEELTERCEAFLRRVHTLYGDQRIVVVLPIWSSSFTGETAVGTFENCRRIIREQAEKLQLEVADGWYFVPHHADFYADPIHPNALGFSTYANWLVQFLSK